MHSSFSAARVSFPDNRCPVFRDMRQSPKLKAGGAAQFNAIFLKKRESG
jgi:hypothetical protein